MPIKDVMTRAVEMTTPDATLQQAATRMREAWVGFLPVSAKAPAVDVITDRDIVGVITDRDITIRAVAAGLDPRTARVQEAMTPQVVYCYEDQSLDEAIELMERKAVRRLLVLDVDNRVSGVITLDDLATVPAAEPRVGEVLERMAEI